MPTDNYIFKQAGVIPYKIEDGKLMVLLITSRKKQKWIFPKGIIEPELGPEQSAIDELFEEAGAKGNIVHSSIGSYKTKKWSGTCTITIFSLKVEEEFENWPESDFRKRKWVTIKQAVKMISKRKLKLILRKFDAIYKQLE